jgi:hypothetical protein
LPAPDESYAKPRNRAYDAYIRQTDPAGAARLATWIGLVEAFVNVCPACTHLANTRYWADEIARTMSRNNFLYEMIFLIVLIIRFFRSALYLN